jgi:hypothetical protein
VDEVLHLIVRLDGVYLASFT